MCVRRIAAAGDHIQKLSWTNISWNVCQPFLSHILITHYERICILSPGCYRPSSHFNRGTQKKKEGRQEYDSRRTTRQDASQGKEGERIRAALIQSAVQQSHSLDTKIFRIGDSPTPSAVRSDQVHSSLVQTLSNCQTKSIIVIEFFPAVGAEP